MAKAQSTLKWPTRGKNTHLPCGSSKNKEGRSAAAGAWKMRSEWGHISAGGDCRTQLKATAQGKLSTRAGSVCCCEGGEEGVR